MLTVFPFNLILGDDDLAGVGVASVVDGVTQDADGSDHLTHFGDAVHGVAGVADQLLAPGNLLWGRTQAEWLEIREHTRDVESNTSENKNAHLSLRLHSHHLPILHHDLLYGLVQHIRPTVDGAQPGMETR